MGVAMGVAMGGQVASHIVVVDGWMHSVMILMV